VGTRVLFVSVLAGTALGSSAASAVASAPTHARWVSAVDAACIRSQARFDRLPSYDGTLAQLLVVLPKLTKISAALLADVRRVPVAPSDRRLVGRLVHAWNQEITNDSLAYARLKAGDVPGFQKALGASFADNKREDTALQALGSVCRRVPS
jgi:hypothetical protein